MKYCTKCLMPDTKPYLTFDEKGVCSACNASAKKNLALGDIDWDARADEFEGLIQDAKARKAPFYDALVPVSGGKDSITQVHRLLGHGLRILAVNVDYGVKTDIGVHNLNCIPKMGASLVTYRPELDLHTHLIRIGFEDFGDPDLLSHTMLHAYPLHVALRFDIPLVLLGENSAFEYGGDEKIAAGKSITRAWFSKYAANQGRDASYIAREYNIPSEKLVLYDYPDELDASSRVRTVFSGYYFFWDSETHYEIAKEYGFKALDGPREGTYRSYVGIDEKINRIHQYFKVLKFGYGRATDHACEDIRNGRLTREQAKELVREHDLQPISDEYVKDFCAFIGITDQRFNEIIEQYRNADIWKKDGNGEWGIPNHLEDA